MLEAFNKSFKNVFTWPENVENTSTKVLFKNFKGCFHYPGG